MKRDPIVIHIEDNTNGCNVISGLNHLILVDDTHHLIINRSNTNIITDILYHINTPTPTIIKEFNRVPIIDIDTKLIGCEWRHERKERNNNNKLRNKHFNNKFR